MEFTYTHALDREQYSQTQINARNLTTAIDAWAISACKRDCILRIRSKTFRMYYTYMGTHTVLVMILKFKSGNCFTIKIVLYYNSKTNGFKH